MRARVFWSFLYRVPEHTPNCVTLHIRIIIQAGLHSTTVEFIERLMTRPEREGDEEVSKDVPRGQKMIFILFLRVIVHRASEIWSLQRRNAFPCNLDRDLLSTFDSRRSKLFSRNRPQFPNFLFQRQRLTVTTTPIFARRSFKNTKKERRESTHICNSFSLIIHTSFFAT